MTWDTRQIVYPEGDTIEIEHNLRVNELVDLNGRPANLPLSNPKTIIYRVYKKSTTETNNGPIIKFHLEQLNIFETEELSR